MTNIPNILIVSTSLRTKGGVSSVVKELLNSELSDKYIIYHLSTHINGNLFIKIFFLIKSYFCYPLLLIFNNISIVHIHGGMKSSFFRKSYFLIVGKIFRKHVLFHMHSAKIDQYINKSSLIKRYAIKKLLNSYDLIIVISEYWKDVLAQYTNNRIIVVFNPITLSEYIPTRAKHERFTVLTLGELGERKGTESIIKIASLLRNEEILFEIGGNGDLPFYNKLAVEAGVEKSVIFKGWVDGKEKDALLDNSHVYFLPSLFEGLPMSIIEAMAKSLPIIATKVGGIPEIVIDSRNGFTHEPADVEGMSISILKLKRDADLRKNLGAYSYKIVKSRLEKEVIAKEIDNIYSKFLECSILK